jgi:pimeloyl-ACP methyl ester carboxylesterase
MTDRIVPAQHIAEAASAGLRRIAEAAGVADVIPGVSAGAAPIAPWPGSLVSLDVGDVFVRSAPAAPGAGPALFVHGLGGSALNWTDLMGLLSDPAREQPLACEAIDLPGFGYSPPPPDGDYSVDARAAAVIALIEKRGNWPVHLVGNSLGGAISTRVAARRPDLVRSLTLISPALPDLRPRLLPARLAVVTMPGVGRWLLTKMLAMPPEQRADASIAELYAEPARLAPERRAEAIDEVRRRDALDYATDALLGSARALVTEYAKPGPASLWHEASHVVAPTLVIHGSHDRLVNPALAARAARTFRHGRVVVLARTGHVAMMERPEIVAAEMNEFLRGAARGWATGEPATRERAVSDRAPWPGETRGQVAATTARRRASRARAHGWAVTLRAALGSRTALGWRTALGSRDALGPGAALGARTKLGARTALSLRGLRNSPGVRGSRNSLGRIGQ